MIHEEFYCKIHSPISQFISIITKNLQLKTLFESMQGTVNQFQELYVNQSFYETTLWLLKFFIKYYGQQDEQKLEFILKNQIREKFLKLNEDLQISKKQLANRISTHTDASKFKELDQFDIISQDIPKLQQQQSYNSNERSFDHQPILYPNRSYSKLPPRKSQDHFNVFSHYQEDQERESVTFPQNSYNYQEINQPYKQPLYIDNIDHERSDFLFNKIPRPQTSQSQQKAQGNMFKYNSDHTIPNPQKISTPQQKNPKQKQHVQEDIQQKIPTVPKYSQKVQKRSQSPNNKDPLSKSDSFKKKKYELDNHSQGKRSTHFPNQEELEESYFKLKHTPKDKEERISPSFNYKKKVQEKHYNNQTSKKNTAIHIHKNLKTIDIDSRSRVQRNFTNQAKSTLQIS